MPKSDIGISLRNRVNSKFPSIKSTRQLSKRLIFNDLFSIIKLFVMIGAKNKKIAQNTSASLFHCINVGNLNIKTAFFFLSLFVLRNLEIDI